MGTGLVDVVGNGGGAHKAHSLHIGVHQQYVHRFFVTLHDVEHAIGQAGLFQQVGNKQAGGRVDRAGLEHKGVARSNGDGEHPCRHHDRES